LPDHFRIEDAAGEGVRRIAPVAGDVGVEPRMAGGEDGAERPLRRLHQVFKPQLDVALGAPFAEGEARCDVARPPIRRLVEARRTPGPGEDRERDVPAVAHDVDEPYPGK